MIKLISIKAKNFMSFKEFSLDLRKDGLYLVSGWNQLGQDSNGSGKSSILEAICFALFGKTSTGLGPDSVKNWAIKDGLFVQLELASGGVQYKIIRKDKQIEFYEDGSITPAVHKRDIQTVINDTFRTTYDLFTSSTFFSNTKAFIAAQTDKEKKELFKPIFQLHRLDNAYAKVKSLMDTASTSLDNLEFAKSAKEASVRENESTIADLAEKVDAWDVTTAKTIESLKDRLAHCYLNDDPALSLRVSELEDKMAIIQDKLNGSLPLVDAWSEELYNIRLSQTMAKQSWQDTAEVLANLQTRKADMSCESCGQVVPEAVLESRKQDLLNKQDKLMKEYQASTNRGLELDRLITSHEENKERLAVLKSAHQAAKSNLAMHQQAQETNSLRREEIEGQIETIQNSPCPYVETLEKLKAKVQTAMEEISDLTSQVGALSARYDALAFLKWVFSKEGVAAYIIERAYGRLESLANRYLSLISSEGFSLEIRPQKELKSKALKEEIDIVITTKGKRIPYWGLSGGQRQRINIALLISTYRLCRDLGINNFDFLLLDEVLDLSLADKGQADTLRLMRRLLAGEIGQIFIISHKPDVASDFDFVIDVVRNKDGVSSIT